MTIGEKITKLRTGKGISQEQLAEKLSVSRQSISKWEMDQALPQIDKVLQLCRLFDISTDELLREEAEIRRAAFSEKNKTYRTGRESYESRAAKSHENFPQPQQEVQ